MQRARAAAGGTAAVATRARLGLRALAYHAAAGRGRGGDQHRRGQVGAGTRAAVAAADYGGRRQAARLAGAACVQVAAAPHALPGTGRADAFLRRAAAEGGQGVRGRVGDPEQGSMNRVRGSPTRLVMSTIIAVSFLR